MRKNWFWNVVIVLTLIGCISVFVLHYKNWITVETGNFKITSGIYSQKIPLSKIQSVELVPKIPQMERKNGFSWLAKEKGIFLDSITGATVHVFVDDLKQQKIKMAYHDSLTLYFNVSDSTETAHFFSKLNAGLENKE